MSIEARLGKIEKSMGSGNSDDVWHFQRLPKMAKTAVEFRGEELTSENIGREQFQLSMLYCKAYAGEDLSKLDQLNEATRQEFENEFYRVFSKGAK